MNLQSLRAVQPLEAVLAALIRAVQSAWPEMEVRLRTLYCMQGKGRGVQAFYSRVVQSCRAVGQDKHHPTHCRSAPGCPQYGTVLHAWTMSPIFVLMIEAAFMELEEALSRRKSLPLLANCSRSLPTLLLFVPSWCPS